MAKIQDIEHKKLMLCIIFNLIYILTVSPTMSICEQDEIKSQSEFTNLTSELSTDNNYQENDDELLLTFDINKNKLENNRRDQSTREARYFYSGGENSGFAKNNEISDILSESHMQFSLDLLNALINSPHDQESSSKKSNLNSVLLSPASIQSVLMMMHLGARAKTRQEISQGLHFPIAQSSIGATNSNSAPNKFQRRNNNNNNNHIASRRSSSSSSTRSNSETQATIGQVTGQQHSNNSTFSAVNSPAGIQQHVQAPGQHVQVSLAAMHESFANAIKSIINDSSLKSLFTLANQVFYQETLILSHQFESALKHYYNTQIRAVDFQQQQSSNNETSTNNNSIQNMINDWVEKQTRGKIVKFLTLPISPATLLMAINVLHFKGDWQYKFDPSDTDLDATFTLHDGTQTKCPMMMAKLPVAFAHDSQLKSAILELPYRVQRLALFLVLPDEHDKLPQVIQSLNSTSLTSLIRSMRKAQQDQGGINVRIPRFTIDSTPQLTQILGHQLGMRTLFSADLADLSGMFAPIQKNKQSTAGLSLDDLVHKAIFEVDEVGSVGAAASATIVERVGIFNGQYFEADHPFLLFLIDKQSGLILFSGVYAGPQSSSPPVASPAPSTSTNSK